MKGKNSQIVRMVDGQRISGVPVFDLEGKVAIITGAARGIGRGIAWAYAGYGCKLVLVDLLGDTLEQTKEDIHNQFGIDPVICVGDVRDFDFVDQVIQETVSTFGRIDILVNNAGVGMTRLAVDCDEEEFDTVVNTDLKAVFFFAKKVAKVMIEQKKGNIINLSSVVARVGSSRMAPYMAAKAGVLQMTRGLAFEWARFNVRVNCICPGYIETGMTEDTLANPRAYEAITKMIPHERKVGMPEDIAAAAVFLASDCTDLITGFPLYVDAGRSIW